MEMRRKAEGKERQGGEPASKALRTKAAALRVFSVLGVEVTKRSVEDVRERVDLHRV